MMGYGAWGIGYRVRYFIFIFLILNSQFSILNSYAAESGKPKKEKKVKEEVKTEVKEKEEVKIKIEGVLEAGFDINNKLDKSTTDYKKIGTAKVDLSASPVKKVRAEFGFEYKDKDSALIIDKLYGQYNFADFGAVRVGYMKKAFGLEERAGIDERYFHKRSIINDGVENLWLLEHDLTFQYRHKIGTDWRIIGGVSWLSEDTLYHNYSVEYEASKTNLILAAVIGHYTRFNENLTAFATSLSFKSSARLCVSEAEFTFGHKPAVKNKNGNVLDSSAYIWGARVQEYFPIEIPAKVLRQVIPVAEAALYSEDLESKDFDAQLRAGLTLGFAKKSAFQWRNTYGTVLRIADGKKELKRRRYDSEVVVIF